MYWFWTSNAQVELWNDINLWPYLGGFLRIARMFEFRKRNSIEKFSMGVIVEVGNQRNCLVMCLDQNGGVCDNKLSVEGLPAKFLKIFLWYFNKLYLLQLVVKIWSVEYEGDFVCIKRHACNFACLFFGYLNRNNHAHEHFTCTRTLPVPVHRYRGILRSLLPDAYTAEYTVRWFNVLSDWLCSLWHGINISCLYMYTRFQKTYFFFFYLGRKHSKGNTKDKHEKKCVLEK